MNDEEAQTLTNPNGANQWLPDPRQKLCWDFYVDPKSDSFSNAYQSALKAGYEITAAEKITSTEWFGEKRRRMNLLPKAEKVLERHLELPEQYLEDGRIDASLEGIKQKAAMFVAETQGKVEGYTKKSEVGGEIDATIRYTITRGTDNLPKD